MAMLDMLEESLVIKIVSSKDVNRMTKKSVQTVSERSKFAPCRKPNLPLPQQKREVSFCELLFVPVFGRCKHRPAVSLVIAVSCGKLLY